MVSIRSVGETIYNASATAVNTTMQAATNVEDFATMTEGLRDVLDYINPAKTAFTASLGQYADEVWNTRVLSGAICWLITPKAAPQPLEPKSEFEPESSLYRISRKTQEATFLAILSLLSLNWLREIGAVEVISFPLQYLPSAESVANSLGGSTIGEVVSEYAQKIGATGLGVFVSQGGLIPGLLFVAYGFYTLQNAAELYHLNRLQRGPDAEAGRTAHAPSPELSFKIRQAQIDLLTHALKAGVQVCALGGYSIPALVAIAGGMNIASTLYRGYTVIQLKKAIPAAVPAAEGPRSAGDVMQETKGLGTLQKALTTVLPEDSALYQHIIGPAGLSAAVAFPYVAKKALKDVVEWYYNQRALEGINRWKTLASTLDVYSKLVLTIKYVALVQLLPISGSTMATIKMLDKGAMVIGSVSMVIFQIYKISNGETDLGVKPPILRVKNNKEHWVALITSTAKIFAQYTDDNRAKVAGVFAAVGTFAKNFFEKK